MSLGLSRTAASLAVVFEDLLASLVQLVAVLLQTGEHAEGVRDLVFAELGGVGATGRLLLRRGGFN